MPVRNKLSSRQKIRFRIRKKVIGNSDCPRLVVFRSLNNIYAQLVDDISRKTICEVSTLSKDVKDELKDKTTKIAKSKVIGIVLARRALDNNIKRVVFDRNGYLYHGRVKAVADGVREGGLQF